MGGYYETQTGKLIPIGRKNGMKLEEQCREIYCDVLKLPVRPKKDMPEAYRYLYEGKTPWRNLLMFESPHCIYSKELDKLLFIERHGESFERQDHVIYVTENDDDTYDYITTFYNMVFCLSGMLEIGINHVGQLSFYNSTDTFQ